MNTPQKYVFLTVMLVAVLAILSFYQGYTAKERSSIDPTYDSINKEYVKYWKFPFFEPLRLKCDTCSFLPGRVSLKKIGLGEKIDSYDCVIRVDDVSADSDVTDTGDRTTILAVGLESFSKLKSKLEKKNELSNGFFNETIIIGFDETERLAGLYEDLLYSNKNPQLFLFTPRETRKVREKFDCFVADVNNLLDYILVPKEFYVLSLAKDICKEIHVFGIPDAEYCHQIERSKNIIGEKECKEMEKDESILIQKVRQKITLTMQDHITRHYPKSDMV